MENEPIVPDSSSSLEVAEVKPVVVDSSPGPQPGQPHRRPKFTWRYLLIALPILLLVGGSIAGFKYLKKPGKQTAANVVINTQSLDNGTLNQLTPKGDGKVEQQLTIDPNTIFNNNATIQGSTITARNLTVGGTAEIDGATTIKDGLVVGKSVSIGQNLTVNGLITAASLSVGSITISSINVSGDLNFGGHILPSGNKPVPKASAATMGGTVTISGNDTAGTIIITTGSGTATNGEMAIITFHTAFGATPKVQLTPQNNNAATVPYFVTHSAGFFTVNSTSAPAANTTYIFDYLVTQ